MNEAQLNALQNPINTQAELQKAWDNPRRFRHWSPKHIVLINLVVAKDKGKWVWMVGLRILHVKKEKLKPVTAFTKLDYLNATMTLEKELHGVGKGIRLSFSTQYIMYFQDELTEDEIKLLGDQDDTE
jgi:hypothetical protein